MDKLLELHTNLTKEGYELPPINDFRKDMADPKALGELHKNLQAEGYELPDFKTFQSDMFPTATEGAKKKSGNLISRFWRGCKDGFRRYSD